jgi:hypothetical protein
VLREIGRHALRHRFRLGRIRRNRDVGSAAQRFQLRERLIELCAIARHHGDVRPQNRERFGRRTSYAAGATANQRSPLV